MHADNQPLPEGNQYDRRRKNTILRTGTGTQATPAGTTADGAAAGTGTEKASAGSEAVGAGTGKETQRAPAGATGPGKTAQAQPVKRPGVLLESTSSRKLESFP